MKKLIFTPGPTEIYPEVLRAMSKPTTNSDLDEEFYKQFRHISDKISRYMKSDGPTLILVGEAILGLEASLATFLNDGDKVVALANGVFGHGFAGFAEMYGGNPVKIEAPMNSVDFDYDKLEQELQDASICTMVHCETPSGLLNPIDKVGKLCKETDTLFVVDAVSSVFGTKVEMDKWGIDVLLGGTQKALSQPAGLTLITLSEKARQRLGDVTDTASGFYANLTNWMDFLDGENWLPYTHSQSLINAMDTGLQIIERTGLENIYERHSRIAKATRSTITEAGLELFPEEDKINSPTVTAYKVPENIDDHKFRDRLWKKYGLMISGSLGDLEGKIQRLGHMGYQANQYTVSHALNILENAFTEAGLTTDMDWGEYFLDQLD